MIAQMLAIGAAYTLVYLLLRLHRFILVYGKDQQRYCRTYLSGFDETDWSSDRAGDSNNAADSKDTTIAHTVDGHSLAEWPAELELRAEPSTHTARLSTKSHAPTTIHPARAALGWTDRF